MKRAIGAAVLAAVLAVPATWAGPAAHWTHTSEADFKQGKFTNVVATNLGDLKLSRATKTLLQQDPRVDTVYCLVEAPDGTVYAGTGPRGVILSIKGDQVGTAATLEDENVFSLLIDAQGRLLAGTGGEKGRIVRIDKPGAAPGDAPGDKPSDKPGDKPADVFSAEGVQYVWKMVQAADGTIYAATGPSGQVHQIGADGKASVLFDSDENNILSLHGDGKDLLYAGTDPNGLIYRINRRTQEVFVLYDAAESEISALVMDAKGNLYAGTAQDSGVEGMPGAEGAEAATDKTGRPEGGAEVTPLPAPKPNEPKPPEAPDPNPGEPDPIPKNKPSVKPGGNLLLLEAEAQKAVAKALAEADPQQPAPPGGDPDEPGPGPAPTPTPAQQAQAAAQAAGALMPEPPGMDPAAQGNAVYRIAPDGLVTEVFRQGGMVLSMVEKDGALIVGTGSEGLIYEVNPAAEETTVIAKVDPKQVMSLLAAKDGRVVLGLGNVGGIATMSSGFASEGTFTSPVLDAGQITRFGKMHLLGSLPGGAGLTVATRSGNMQEPDGKGWSKWSEEMTAAEFLQVPSPTARFLQYRLTLASKDGATTAVVDELDVAHQIPNVTPQVKTVRVMAGGADADGGGGSGMPNAMAMQGMGMGGMPGANGQAAGAQSAGGRMRVIQWEATDLNTDALEYELHVRRGTRGPWVLLADKLKEPMFQWDTRGVADGRYLVRVTASDLKSNPRGEGRAGNRVSDPVSVDNTPPAIGDVKAAVEGKNVRIDARLLDRTSTITGVDYAINSKADWQAVKASDNIFDSPEEGVSFTIEGLAAGAYQIVVRATDGHGNQAYETMLVTVEK